MPFDLFPRRLHYHINEQARAFDFIGLVSRTILFERFDDGSLEGNSKEEKKHDDFASRSSFRYVGLCSIDIRYIRKSLFRIERIW